MFPLGRAIILVSFIIVVLLVIALPLLGVI